MTHPWVSVTTVLAPAWLICLHSAYLKLLGVDLCVYFIDRPASYTEAELDELSQHAKLFLCDDAYWQSVDGRPTEQTGRQLKNIAVARSQVDARWFLHLDIDEFPFFAGDIARMLASAPVEVSEFHFQNVERLIVRGGSRWHEGWLRLPNFDHELQARHYGQRTTFMGAGLACYYHGKSLVKNEPRLVQGLHTAMSVRPDYEVVRMTVPIDQGFVVHYPCITRQHFAHRLQRNKFRVPEVRKFRHETLLDTFLFGPGGHPDKADLMVTALHTCSVEEARRWSEAGLCRSMPTACLQLFEQAAGESDVLHVGFADRSFAEFYQG